MFMSGKWSHVVSKQSQASDDQFKIKKSSLLTLYWISGNGLCHGFS